MDDMVGVFGRAVAVAALVVSSGAGAAPLGGDAPACAAGNVPAIQVNVVGLKDRSGSLKLELYPATEEDFLKDDDALVTAGKVFRRVQVATPSAGLPSLCIRVPRPGRYALLFTHDRDGKQKFNFWKDGVGLPGTARLGRTRPTLPQAVVEVGSGVTSTNITAQYLRGLGGFGPVS